MRFGPFEIERPLGRGGMAETFVATLRGAQGFTRTVCLKRILAEHAASPAFVRAFQEEAKLAMRLVHPHIAQVYDFGEVDGAWWMSLELVGGGDLRQLLAGLKQPLPLDVALLLAIDLASALMYAHELVVDGRAVRLVHRDVSPSNVLIDEQGNFKLVDFGIAKSTLSATDTTTGKIKGKACYMAPEQGMGKKLDARADLWALGVVLYEALAGVRPFDASSDLATILLVTQGDRKKLAEVAPHVPPDVCEIVERLLAVDPDARFQSAAALLDALEHRPPPPNARRRLAEMLRTLASGARPSEPAPPKPGPDQAATGKPSGAPEATLAITSLALSPSALDEPVPSAPDDVTRTRTVYDAALGRAIEAGAFAETLRHDSLPPGSPRSVPPASSAPSPSVVVAQETPRRGPSSRPPARGSSMTAIIVVVGLVGVVLGATAAALVVRWTPPSGAPTVAASGVDLDASRVVVDAGVGDTRTWQDVAAIELDAGEPRDDARLAAAAERAFVDGAGSPGAPDAAAEEDAATPRAETAPRDARDGRIEIVVVPWGRVHIDGQDMGRAPYRGRLPVGPHRVEVIAGELSAVRTVRVRAGQTARVSIALAE